MLAGFCQDLAEKDELQKISIVLEDSLKYVCIGRKMRPYRNDERTGVLQTNLEIHRSLSTQHQTEVFGKTTESYKEENFKKLVTFYLCSWYESHF